MLPGRGCREPRGDVRLTVDPDVPPVRADAAHLERAFANLLENAVRYSGGRPVSVQIRRSGSRVVARVVDQGPGNRRHRARPDLRALLSGPAHPSTGREAGSGLGLSIAKGFIEANGGTISVESLPGQGSSFVVSLPIEVPSAQPEHEPAIPT